MYRIATLLGILALSTIARGQEGIPADKGEVKTTTHGVKYCVLKAGDGARKVNVGDMLTVHYSGWLENGTLFDSSKKAPDPKTGKLKPASFKLLPGSVIHGWVEGLSQVNVGDKVKLTIPADLGYGKRPRPGIPANSTLIFEVEVLKAELYCKPPTMPASNKEKQQTTESGIRWEIIEDGTGAAPSMQDMAGVLVSAFSPEGNLLFLTEPENRITAMPLRSIKVPFLLEMLPKMKRGARYRFEVPPELGMGPQGQPPLLKPNSPTVWDVKITAPQPLPKFEAIPEEGDNVKKTGSGLRYVVLKEGTGPKAGIDSKVRVNYAGWFTDGKSFDSSYSRGCATEFPLKGVIKGWQEGLQLMNTGAVYRFHIPWSMAYGEKGRGTIPAKADLIFHVELLRIDQ